MNHSCVDVFKYGIKAKNHLLLNFNKLKNMLLISRCRNVKLKMFPPSCLSSKGVAVYRNICWDKIKAFVLTVYSCNAIPHLVDTRVGLQWQVGESDKPIKKGSYMSVMKAPYPEYRWEWRHSDTMISHTRTSLRAS